MSGSRVPSAEGAEPIDDDAAMASSAGDRAYLAEVMEEIEEEVRRRRASGDLPVRLERELDELFLAHSPVTGRGGAIEESLQMVDSAAFIDPVVPVASNKSGGAALKKGLRSLNLWYIGYITHQVSQFASAVSRTLHLVDDRLADLTRQLDAQQVPLAPVLGGSSDPDAWWVSHALGALGKAQGRVLHAACGDGWLVQALVAGSVDAYGVEPRPGLIDEAEQGGVDLREEGVLEHLRAVESAALGGIVLSGIVDGMSHGERTQLLNAVAGALAPGGTVVVHSLSMRGWRGDDAPIEADLSPGHPLRPSSWVHLLGQLGLLAEVHGGPGGDDYLVVAVGDGSPNAR